MKYLLIVLIVIAVTIFFSRNVAESGVEYRYDMDNNLIKVVEIDKE